MKVFSFITLTLRVVYFHEVQVETLSIQGTLYAQGYTNVSSGLFFQSPLKLCIDVLSLQSLTSRRYRKVSKLGIWPQWDAGFCIPRAQKAALSI